MGTRFATCALATAIVVPIALALSGSALRGASFAEFLGTDDPLRTEQRIATELRTIEQRTAMCMRNAGFTFVPVVTSVAATGISALSPLEFAREYGFGIVDAGAEPNIDDTPDPNIEIVRGLSRTERRQYLAALNGESGSRSLNPEGEYGGGCRGAAREFVYGPRDALWHGLDADLSDMAEKVRADPRVRRAEIAWSRCLRDSGWSVPDRHALTQIITVELPAEVERAALLPTNARTESLASIQRRERDLAVTVIQCDGLVVPLIEAVKSEYESDFVLGHFETMVEIRSEYRRFEK